jgi:hypothetical protein
MSSSRPAEIAGGVFVRIRTSANTGPFHPARQFLGHGVEVVGTPPLWRDHPFNFPLFEPSNGVTLAVG